MHSITASHMSWKRGITFPQFETWGERCPQKTLAGSETKPHPAMSFHQHDWLSFVSCATGNCGRLRELARAKSTGRTTT